MDYSYLNQAAAAAAAGFEASSCALAAGEMQCGYGDLSSCSQMSQAAYRYTAARAAGYPGNAAAAAGAAAGGTPLTAHHTAHPHAHTHHGAHSTPCSVMAARSQEVWFQNRRAKFRKQERLAQQKSTSQSGIGVDSGASSPVAGTVKAEGRSPRSPATPPGSSNSVLSSNEIKPIANQSLVNVKHTDGTGDGGSPNARGSSGGGGGTGTWGSCSPRPFSAALPPYLLDPLPLKTANLY
ncbi:hypothetical protein P5V15_004555 [Pogonomyrmex californicus]